MECDFTIEKIYSFKCSRCHSKIEYTENDENVEKFYKIKKFNSLYTKLEYGREINTYHTIECPICGKKQAQFADHKFIFTKEGT